MTADTARRNTFPPFPLATIEHIAREIGDLYTGADLTVLLVEAGLRATDPGSGNTKWRPTQPVDSRPAGKVASP